MKGFKRSRVAVIIPARYASSRFPGKPLAILGDRSVIQRVYEQALKSVEIVFVATDDNRIREAVINFGGNVIMTSPEHMSGTDRCSEAASKIESETGLLIDVVINIQGDEPFIKPDQIDLLISCFNDDSVEIATLVRKVTEGEDLSNTNQVKVVIGVNGDAIYFSRAIIPYLRDVDLTEWSYKHIFYKHLGIYAYTTHTLKKLTALNRSSLEIAESLEQNRWIENGFRIRTAITEWESIGIDTPEDLEKAKDLINDFNYNNK
ncbi:MAG: 3-deoxy-manno-octulosonate cytidylyltransferase [Odoribacter sp.]|nr:3-deoxy-manno-octulosonate cytidylyltransferase [Odoribacter sp.]